MGRRARAWGRRSPGTTCAATGGSAVPGLPPRDQPTQALTHARARSPSVLWVDRMTLERAPQLQSLRQLVRKIDNLVIGELRKRDPYLKFVEERSDPMLAIYPADGAEKLRQEAYVPFACGGNAYYAHGLPPNFHFETGLRDK